MNSKACSLYSSMEPGSRGLESDHLSAACGQEQSGAYWIQAGPQKEQSSKGTWARAPETETGCKSPASLAVMRKEVQCIFPEQHYGSQDLGYRLGPLERTIEKLPALGVMGAGGWFYKKSSCCQVLVIFPLCSNLDKNIIS